MRSILTGILFIIGGLTGSLVLRGTGSSGALVLVGVVVLVIGFVRLSTGDGAQGMQPSEADLERDDEQWAEYQRSKAKAAARQELDALLAATPGAQATVEELMEKTKARLSSEEQLALALETARRLSAEQQPTA